MINRKKQSCHYTRVIVRPYLEYCCQVWSPYLSKGRPINLIEGVQRRAIELIKDIKNLSYDERLENLGLSRLTTTMEKIKLINHCFSKLTTWW